MAISIDLEAPLSADDRAYLLERGRRYLVLQNDRRFADGEDSDAPTPAPQESDESDQDDWEEQVSELNVEELRDALSDRNLSTSGNKDALRKRLVEAGPEKS